VTPLAWVAACSGLLLAGLIAVAVLYDVWAVQSGRTTISAWTLRVSREYPILPFVLGLALGLILGALAGHLWLYQTLQGAG
jgi:hypothetical protein